MEFHSETFSNNGGVSSFFIDAIALPGKPSTCTPSLTHLTLTNQVINDSGGTAQASNWVLTASGPSTFSGQGPEVSGSALDPGGYNLSANGPGGYVASDWSCQGGTQQDGDTILLQIGQSAVCTITYDDVDGNVDINYGHAGAWYDPETSGQGVLIDIRPDDQFLFLAWFTYTDADSANPNQHRWLTAQGKYAGDTATLVLYEILGGSFDTPQEVSTNAIGEVTLRFHDCEQADLSFLIEGEGLQGSIPLQRLIPGSQNLCQELSGASTQAVDINDGMDGGWYEEETSGQGFLIDTYLNAAGDNFMFVAWFTYGDDTASGLRWLTAQGEFEGSIAELTISETTGGSFNDPLKPNTVPVGTLLIDFSDCSHAVLTYALPNDGAEGEIDLIRLLPGSEALCQVLSAQQ
jgi:hypothetical protein